MRLAVLVTLASTVWLALLSGCSSEMTGAQQLGAACRTNTDMPSAGCECLSELAAKRLSEPAAIWLATAMQGETERAKQLKDDVPWSELVEASLFMASASQECALNFDEEAFGSLD